MKLKECMVFYVLVCGASVGYVQDDQDFSTCRVYQKIMEGRKPKLNSAADETKESITPRQDLNFDDSDLSVLSIRKRSRQQNKTPKATEKHSPKSVMNVDVSGDLSLSQRSTVEFIGGQYYVSESDKLLLEKLKNISVAVSAEFLSSSVVGGDARVSKSGEIQLTNLMKALSCLEQKEEESVGSSVVFSQLKESITSIRSSACHKEGKDDFLSLLELLPGLDEVLLHYRSLSLSDLF